jgi:hypothetical protein
MMQRGNCILCPNQHSPFACPEYERKSIEVRRAIIRTQNLCFTAWGIIAPPNVHVHNDARYVIRGIIPHCIRLHHETYA